MQYVEDDRKPFAYTIGLHKRGFAEFLVTGVIPDAGDAPVERVANDTVREVLSPRLGISWTLVTTSHSNS